MAISIRRPATVRFEASPPVGGGVGMSYGPTLGHIPRQRRHNGPMRPTRQEADPLVAHGAVAAAVLATWWLAYGRTTPFPSLCYVEPKSEQLGWFAAAAGIVAVLLAGCTWWAPEKRWYGAVGTSTWLVLSVWSTRRGDGDGLWALVIPVYLLVGFAMLAVVELVRSIRKRFMTAGRM